MKKRMPMIVSLALLLLATISIATNYSCLKRLTVAYGYNKGNGESLTYSIASAFEAPHNIQGYSLTKSAVEKLGLDNTLQYDVSLKEATKHNLILKGKQKKADGNNIIHIDQCILIKDLKSMYLFYHTYFSDNDNIIHLSLNDPNGNLISEAAFTDEKKGTILRTSENYFWDIDYEKYEKIMLHVKVYTAANKYLYEYQQPLF